MAIVPGNDFEPASYPGVDYTDDGNDVIVSGIVNADVTQSAKNDFVKAADASYMANNRAQALSVAQTLPHSTVDELIASAETINLWLSGGSKDDGSTVAPGQAR